MIAKYSVDTNILIYLVDARESKKHQQVGELYKFLLEQHTVLSLQVLNEFYHVVTRKKLLSMEEAKTVVLGWVECFDVVCPTLSTFDRATELHMYQGFSFWDAQLIAIAEHHHVRYFFSEDGQHQRKMGKLEVINPFEIKDLDGYFP